MAATKCSHFTFLMFIIFRYRGGRYICFPKLAARYFVYCPIAIRKLKCATQVKLNSIAGAGYIKFTV